jgi:hypothetical protein
LNSSGIEETSHTRCLASKATLASLTRSYWLPVVPASPDVAVRPGRKPLVPQVLPPSVEREKPISVAPPLKKRPTWNADTTVDPADSVSGSTSVACWLVLFGNGSWLICVSATLAVAAPGRASAAPATSAAIEAADLITRKLMSSTLRARSPACQPRQRKSSDRIVVPRGERPACQPGVTFVQAAGPIACGS